MNTIKVIGGGPLVGKTFYGTKEVVLDRSTGETDISLRLDEEPFPQGGHVRTFNVATGYLSEGGGETDLLKVDPKDLAKTWF
jgi:hypothetical protein